MQALWLLYCCCVVMSVAAGIFLAVAFLLVFSSSASCPFSPLYNFVLFHSRPKQRRSNGINSNNRSIPLNSILNDITIIIEKRFGVFSFFFNINQCLTCLLCIPTRNAIFKESSPGTRRMGPAGHLEGGGLGLQHGTEKSPGGFLNKSPVWFYGMPVSLLDSLNLLISLTVPPE